MQHKANVKMMILTDGRFASEIVDVILTTPLDWSARIGIFGKWGEGKSTVLRFAEGMLKEKGNIVFWFSPSVLLVEEPALSLRRFRRSQLN